MTELWYRLNVFAEKPFFNNKFADGLIVPANLIAYYEIAMPELLNECRLPFLIDPMSYVWGIDAPISENGGLRKSFTKLVEKLNCSTASMLGNQKIQTIREGSSEFDEFILNFLRLQMINMPTSVSPRRQSIDRIKRFKQKEVLKESSCFPYALIPPYFYFETIIGNSYQKTLYAANKAKDTFAEKHKIFPCLCMSKNLLAEEEYIRTLVQDFKDFDGVNLWISDFDETYANLIELSNFSKLIKGISESELEVVNFYGGYFSLMLHHVGLSKLSCGICYSRSKQVQSPQGGGGLPIRYYEPHLKRKLPIADMALLYSEIPELFTCTCPICSSYSEQFTTKSKDDRDKILVDFFTGKKSQDGKTTHGVIDWEKSRLHFLYTQKAEKEQIESESLSDTIDSIRENYTLLKKKQLKEFRYGSYEYLKLWADSLQVFKP